MINVRIARPGTGTTYLSIRAIATQTCVLGQVRTHLLRSEEQFIHLHGCRTHEVFESSWPLWIEFPQAKGATLAGQKTPNQHNLHHCDQIDLPLLEVSNPALQ